MQKDNNNSEAKGRKALLDETVAIMKQYESTRVHNFTGRDLFGDLIFQLLSENGEYNEEAVYNLKFCIEHLIELFISREGNMEIPDRTISKVASYLPRLLDFFTALSHEEYTEKMDFWHVDQYGHIISETELLSLREKYKELTEIAMVQEKYRIIRMARSKAVA